MKKTIYNKLLLPALVVLGLGIAFSSCKKDSDGRPENSPGSMSVSMIDPGFAAGGEVLILKGSGLGDIRSVVFDKNDVPATIMATLNTETSLVFRVPDTAFGGDQNIVFTNSAGKTASVPFKVIALPTVTGVSIPNVPSAMFSEGSIPTDFAPGSTITLIGNNLDDVSKVVLEGTTDEATIVSQTRKEMVITMPQTNAVRGKLNLTNLSGSRVTDFEFVNVEKTIPFFIEEWATGVESWGWGGEFKSSADVSVTGAKSLKAALDPGGSWGALSMHSNAGAQLSGNSYISFWIKGADVEKKFKYMINWGTEKTLVIPPNKWTYFKFPIATNYGGVQKVYDLIFQIHEGGKTIYFDNIMIVP